MQKLSSRFQQLVTEIDELEASKTEKFNELGTHLDVDANKLLGWRVKAKSLIEKTCGPKSVHMTEFCKKEEGGMYQTHLDILLKLRAIFSAAQDDYDGGFLATTASLIAAELFDDQLEQASELLRTGYLAPAAVVAGVVLETTLRQLCDLHNLGHGKLDKMNSDLHKAGVYTLLVQKRITALADVRNNAAHGNQQSYAEADVVDLIDYVRRFAGDHIGV